MEERDQEKRGEKRERKRAIAWVCCSGVVVAGDGGPACDQRVESRHDQAIYTS